MNPRISFFISLLCMAHFSFGQGKLHAILFADTEEKVIGEGCQKNFDAVRRLLQEVASNTKQTLIPYYYDGEECTSENLNKILSALEVAPEDAVFFYYAGHGESTESRWPQLTMSQSEESIGLLTIDEKIALKKPKMQLVIGECCNKENDSFTFAQGTGRNALKYSKRYQDLFANEAKVLICASAKGTPAYINEDEGGIFFKVFEQELHTELTKKDKATWKNLLFRVELAMSGLDIKVNGKIQTPSPTPYYEGYQMVNNKKEKIQVVSKR